MRLNQGWIVGLCIMQACVSFALEDNDAYEPNDSRPAAYIGLSSNQWLSTISGSGIAGGFDYYRITVPDRQEKVTIECTFSHAGGNIDLEFYNSIGSLIDRVDTASDNETLTDVRVPGPGTYYIRVYGNGFNSYDLRWSTTYWDYEDDYEENDSIAAAYVGLASNQWLSAISGDGVAGDFDYYEIIVQDRQEIVSIECTITHADGNIDLELYTPSGSLIDRVDTATDNETLTDVRVPGPGTYYIRVYGNGRNPYDLRWSTAYWDYEDDYEENDSRGAAYAGLASNQWLSAVSGDGVAGDFDYYEIIVQDRQEIVSAECTFVHGDGNISLLLENAIGSQIAFSETSSDDETLTNIRVPGAGTYYLRVYGNGRNPYDLRWSTTYWDHEDDYEPNDTKETAYVGLASNEWLAAISGDGVAGNFDFYEIIVPDRQEKVSVECVFTHADGNINLELYTETGSQVDHIDTASDNETLTDVRVPGPGTYFIRVYGTDRNPYDLLWSTTYWDYEDDYEPNDSRETAYTGLAPNQWLSSISGAGVAAYFDYYEIVVPEGIDTVSVECTFTHADGNMDLELYTEIGALVARVDSLTDNETLSDVTIPAPGTYYIRVYGNGRNPYDLRWIMGGPVDLAVSTIHGTATPTAGIHTMNAGTVVSCSVSPAVSGGTGVQYECIGWIGTGSVPASGTSSSVQVTLTENSSIRWNWQTNYWLEASISGNGSINPPEGFYAKDSEQILLATPAAGWLFMGWSDNASGTNDEAIVIMDSPKTVTATFSDDADDDGLTNNEEAALGSNPWKKDTDDDGFDDKLEADHNWNPTVSDQWAVDYIRDNGGDFNLYSSNVVLDVAIGEMLLDVVGTEATLSLQLEASEDLQSWTNAGPIKVWNWTVDGDQKFFRVQSAQ